MRQISPEESRHIGRLLGDPFVTYGHPLTCNGGNPDPRSHHDHEVVMLMVDDIGMMACPECGRHQDIPGGGVN